MPSNAKNTKPLTHRALAKRSRLPASGKAKSATLPLLDISVEGLKAPRLIRKDGRLRVVATLDAKGLRPQRRFERIPTTALNPKTIDPKLLKQELPGYRPPGMPTTFLPKLGKPTMLRNAQMTNAATGSRSRNSISRCSAVGRWKNDSVAKAPRP